MTDTKPPAQSVGVQGFVAFDAEAKSRAPTRNWTMLINLPPFQMFMVEVHSKQPGWIVSAQNYASAYSDEQMETLFDEYCRWHEQKGYWPNETPMGEIKQQEEAS